MATSLGPMHRSNALDLISDMPFPISQLDHPIINQGYCHFLLSMYWAALPYVPGADWLGLGWKFCWGRNWAFTASARPVMASVAFLRASSCSDTCGVAAFIQVCSLSLCVFRWYLTGGELPDTYWDRSIQINTYYHCNRSQIRKTNLNKYV